MSKKLSRPIRTKLEELLANVGDMALKRRARKTVEELFPHAGDKIIDVGCGNGYYSYLLANLPISLELTGVDSSPDAVRDARIYLGDKPVNFVVAGIESLPFGDDVFDKAVMSEVIEHVPHDKRALHEVYRILKPGGILLLTTTSCDYPLLWDPLNWALERLFGWHIKSGFWAGIWNQHPKLYRPGEITKVVKQGGFLIEKVENLTWWCLPFNHYWLNLAAKLLYDKHLPLGVSNAISKFKNQPKPLWIQALFGAVNLFDRLNDRFPCDRGVSIFIKGRKA